MEELAVVVVSYSGKEINAKLVYYGAGLSGKTTNLESIYEAVPEKSRGKMVSMKTQSDRTLFFDLLPLDLGEIMGFKTRFLLYTVPGQVFYNATRKLVLKGADAIVFVADSEVGKMEENKESLANLRANLSEYGLRLEDIPWVIQYNKRDLPSVYSVEELNAALNPDGKIPSFEAVATQGTGVFETFRGISHLLMEKVTRELRRAPLTGAARHAKADVGGPSHEPPLIAASDSESTPDVPIVIPELRETTAPAAGSPLELDYGRDVSLTPSETPLAPSGEGVKGPFGSRGGAGSGPQAGGRAPSEWESRPPTRANQVQTDYGPATMSTSPARPGVRGAAAATETGAGPSEMVVPLTLPRNGTREIVLRIVISDGE